MSTSSSTPIRCSTARGRRCSSGPSEGRRPLRRGAFARLASLLHIATHTSEPAMAKLSLNLRALLLLNAFDNVAYTLAPFTRKDLAEVDQTERDKEIASMIKDGLVHSLG